jgi:hypothetical protein
MVRSAAVGCGVGATVGQLPTLDSLLLAQQRHGRSEIANVSRERPSSWEVDSV